MPTTQTNQESQMSQENRFLSAWVTTEGGVHYRSHRPPGGLSIIVSVVHGVGWSVCHTDRTRSYPKGPETGDAGKTAADRKAVELGWVLEGGVFGEPVATHWTASGSPPPTPRPDDAHRYWQPKAVLGVWHTIGSRHVRCRYDEQVMVDVMQDGGGKWWWKVQEPSSHAFWVSREGAPNLDDAKEAADRKAEQIGWSLNGGAFKAPGKAQAPGKTQAAEPKPVGRDPEVGRFDVEGFVDLTIDRRTMDLTKAQALRLAVDLLDALDAVEPAYEDRRIISAERAKARRLHVDALIGDGSLTGNTMALSISDLAWTVEQLHAINKAAIDAGEEQAKALQALVAEIARLGADYRGAREALVERDALRLTVSALEASLAKAKLQAAVVSLTNGAAR